MTNVYLQESNEFVPVTILKNGVPITDATGVSFSIVPSTNPNTRPGTYVDAVALGNLIGFYTAGFPLGQQEVIAKIVADPETPVVDCGHIIIA